MQTAEGRTPPRISGRPHSVPAGLRIRKPEGSILGLPPTAAAFDKNAVVERAWFTLEPGRGLPGCPRAQSIIATHRVEEGRCGLLRRDRLEILDLSPIVTKLRAL